MAFKKIFGRKAKPLSPRPSNDTDNMNGCFECNICLDSVRDPVVTLCGHLYCWPCLHKWFTIQSTSLGPDEHPQCPVCKAEVSQSTLVPLYGRGETANGSRHNEAATSGSVPPRPPAHHATRELVGPTSQNRADSISEPGSVLQSRKKSACECCPSGSRDVRGDDICTHVWKLEP